MSKLDELKEKTFEAAEKTYGATLRVLEMKGDKIAKNENYSNLMGIEAVYYYLIQKHHWLPSQIKSMSIEDLSLCMEEE